MALSVASRAGAPAAMLVHKLKCLLQKTHVRRYEHLAVLFGSDRGNATVTSQRNPWGPLDRWMHITSGTAAVVPCSRCPRGAPHPRGHLPPRLGTVPSLREPRQSSARVRRADVVARSRSLLLPLRPRRWRRQQPPRTCVFTKAPRSRFLDGRAVFLPEQHRDDSLSLFCHVGHRFGDALRNERVAFKLLQSLHQCQRYIV